jgi:sugar lactone lactonase YvrE
VWFGDGRYLLADIPNNRIMHDEATGTFGAFRQPANFSNGKRKDRQDGLSANIRRAA